MSEMEKASDKNILNERMNVLHPTLHFYTEPIPIICYVLDYRMYYDPLLLASALLPLWNVPILLTSTFKTHYLRVCILHTAFHGLPSRVPGISLEQCQSISSLLPYAVVVCTCVLTFCTLSVPRDQEARLSYFGSMISTILYLPQFWYPLRMFESLILAFFGK